MAIDQLGILSEIRFQATRSGGSGGQNVNKVETAIHGFWSPQDSQFLSQEEKVLLTNRLANRLTKAGEIVIKSQIHRSQLSNKEEVITMMFGLIRKSLEVKRLRIATKPSAKVREQRLELKKRQSALKQIRQHKKWQ